MKRKARRDNEDTTGDEQSQCVPEPHDPREDSSGTSPVEPVPIIDLSGVLKCRASLLRPSENVHEHEHSLTHSPRGGH